MSSFATRQLWNATSGSAAPITGTALTTIIVNPTAAQLANGTGSNLFLSSLQLVNNSATVATLVNVVSGASTVVATFYLPAQTASVDTLPVSVVFGQPLPGTVGAALNLQAVTTGANIYWNAQGFYANP